MGYAVGYEAKHITAFLYSLRNTGFAGDIVLGMGPRRTRDPAIAPLLRSVNATARAVTGDDDANADAALAPQMRRFADYDAWLAAYPPDAAVLVTDVRDVVFQSDPLAPERFRSLLALDGTAGAGEGAAGVLLFGQGLRFEQDLSGNNLHWVQRCWTDLQDASFWNKKMLINSGVMLGTRDGVRGVARAMVAESVATGCAGKGGFDQGILNRLVYGSAARLRVVFAGNGAAARGLPATAIAKNSAALLAKVYADPMDGPVATIGSLKYLSRDESPEGKSSAHVLLRDAGGFILHRAPTTRGVHGRGPVYERAPVIHQWDRFLSLLGDWVSATLAKKNRWLCPSDEQPSGAVATAWRCSCVGMEPNTSTNTYMRCPTTCYRPVERRTIVVQPFYRATLRDKCASQEMKDRGGKRKRKRRHGEFVDEASGARFVAGGRLCSAKSWWKSDERVPPWDQEVPDWYNN